MSTLNLPDLEVYDLKIHVLTFLGERHFHKILPNKKWLHDFTIVEFSYDYGNTYSHSITFDKSQNAYEILKSIKATRINSKCTHLRSEIFKQFKCLCCSKTCTSDVVCGCGVCVWWCVCGVWGVW